MTKPSHDKLINSLSPTWLAGDLALCSVRCCVVQRGAAYRIGRSHIPTRSYPSQFLFASRNTANTKTHCCLHSPVCCCCYRYSCCFSGLSGCCSPSSALAPSRPASSEARNTRGTNWLTCTPSQQFILLGAILSLSLSVDLAWTSPPASYSHSCYIYSLPLDFRERGGSRKRDRGASHTVAKKVKLHTKEQVLGQTHRRCLLPMRPWFRGGHQTTPARER